MKKPSIKNLFNDLIEARNKQLLRGLWFSVHEIDVRFHETDDYMQKMDSLRKHIMSIYDGVSWCVCMYGTKSLVIFLNKKIKNVESLNAQIPFVDSPAI